MVSTERWCYDLYDSDRQRHARMDMVVFVAGMVFYLDVACSHPFSAKGAVRSDGKVANATLKKHARYVTVRDGVRTTAARLVPIALSTYGAVGSEARAFFGALRLNAGSTGEDFDLHGSNSLIGLCSYLAVMHSAHNALAAHTSFANGPRGRGSTHAVGASIVLGGKVETPLRPARDTPAPSAAPHPDHLGPLRRDASTSVSRVSSASPGRT